MSDFADIKADVDDHLCLNLGMPVSRSASLHGQCSYYRNMDMKTDTDVDADMNREKDMETDTEIGQGYL
jgi:hypothetical protein